MEHSLTVKTMTYLLKRIFKKITIPSKNKETKPFQGEKDLFVNDEIYQGDISNDITRETGIRVGIILGSVLLAMGNESMKSPLQGLTIDLLNFAEIQRNMIQKSIDGKTDKRTLNRYYHQQIDKHTTI